MATVPIESCVGGLVDLAHPTGSDQADELVVTKLGSGRELHAIHRRWAIEKTIRFRLFMIGQ